jgi:hypothetical protein
VNNNPLRYTDPTGHCIDPDSCPQSIQNKITPPIGATGTITTNRGSSLGTHVGSGTVVTHDHFSGPVTSVTYTDSLGLQHRSNSLPKINRTFETSHLSFVNTKVAPAAPVASASTIANLKQGDEIQVVYYDNYLKTAEYFNTTITRINSTAFTFADPLQIINLGDSGGGIFFKGELIGNTWAYTRVTLIDGTHLYNEGIGALYQHSPPVSEQRRNAR